MTSNFADHSDGPVAEHLPDPLHRGEISVQLAFEPGVSIARSASAVELPLTANPFRAIALNGEISLSTTFTERAIGVSAAGHGSRGNDDPPMTTVGSSIDPWPLLRNGDLGCQRAIRLVVHGRSGGVVPDSLIELSQSLQRRRSAPVQLEVLTAESAPVCPKEASWLVPLLLWPGSHAREDVPEIRNRMQREGAEVSLLPFLGSWQRWWTLVAEALQPFAVQDSVLVHHPLSSDEADRFLLQLSDRMGLPLLSFDHWSDYQQTHPQARPLMLALAPNRMTEALSEAGSLPPLLDHSLIRQGLIDLLAALP